MWRVVLPTSTQQQTHALSQKHNKSMLTKFPVFKSAAAALHLHLHGQSQPRRGIAFIRTAFNAVDCERLNCVGAERLCAEWMLKNDGRVRLQNHLPPPAHAQHNDGQVDPPFCLAQQKPASSTSSQPPACAAKPSPCAAKRVVNPTSGLPECPPSEKQQACETKKPVETCTPAEPPKPPPKPVCSKPPVVSVFFTNYNHLPSEKLPICILELDATGSSVTGTGFAHLRGCRSIERLVLVDCKYVTNDACQWLCMIKETLHTLQISNCPGINDCGLMHLERLKKLKRLELDALTGVKDMNKCREALALALPDCDVRVQC